MPGILARMIARLCGRTTIDAERQARSLTFSRISGVGDIICRDCGHAEELHAFTHGFGDYSDFTMSAQCQGCGAFKEFTSRGLGPSGLAPTEKRIKDSCCECGGRYSREEALFCSSCRSRDLEFAMRYIT